MSTPVLLSLAPLLAQSAGVVPDAWRTTSAEGAPLARTDDTGVWTGREVIVWGGLDAAERHLGDGGAYDPATDTWRSIASAGAPSPRAWHTAVWSGREMLVFGGDDPERERGDGAAYDPRLDRWRPLATAGAPDARSCHLAVWAGDEMFVWAGVTEEHAYASGATYDPAEDAWSPFRLDLERRIPRTLPGVWTGAHVLAWGGINGSHALGHGVRWDPVGRASHELSAADAPSPRAHHSAVWTGAELVVWGGGGRYDASGALGDGGRFDPELDRWRPLPARGAPAARLGHGAVWTGEEMVVVGGATKRDGTALADAHAWRTDGSWRRLPDLPAGRAFAHAFDTAHGVVVIGGSDAGRPRRGGFVLGPDRR